MVHPARVGPSALEMRQWKLQNSAALKPSRAKSDTRCDDLPWLLDFRDGASRDLFRYDVVRNGAWRLGIDDRFSVGWMTFGLFQPPADVRRRCMNNIVLLFVCLLLGMGLRAAKKVPENAHLALNAFIIHISLPALIILQIHSVKLHTSLLFSIAMPWLMFALGVLFFWALSARLKFSRETTGALMLAGGLANTSFVGLPMIEAFFGAPDMATGILIDQLGTYLVLSTLGITVATIYSAGAGSKADIFKRIIVFPPLIALGVAFALMPFEFPTWIADALKRLGDTLAPLALVSVGLQLRFDQTKGLKTALATGLGFKLLLAPAALALLYFGILGTAEETTRVTLFEAAMGPQIGGAIVAVQHGLNPPLVSLMVGLGISLSFLTLPLWSYALHHF